MGIFKKKTSNEISITPKTSDEEREAEKVRQLEASLDFLRDRKADGPSKKRIDPSKKLVPEGTGDFVKEEAKEEAKEETKEAKEETKEAKEVTKEEVKAGPEREASSKPDTPENSGANEAAKRENVQNIGEQSEGPEPDALYTGSAESDSISPSVATEASVKEDSPNGSESVALAEKKPAPIKNKYGRRMDYRTAIVKNSSSDQPQAEKAVQAPDGNTGSAGQADAEVRAPQADAVSDVSEKKAENSDKNAPTGNVIPGQSPERRKPEISAERKAETQAENERAATAESSKKTANQIPNPLPTPAKHTPRELDFDIQPEPQQMHFDLVDLAGMDYFDIN